LWEAVRTCGRLFASGSTVKTEDALANCEETVRRHDPDRYFASLFAPASRRPLLFTLYAFNYEIARLGAQSREPMMGVIRLQWWRETVEQAREGRPRAHPAAVGLAALFANSAPPQALFETMLDAREFDVLPGGFADLAALEAYGEATSSNLMRIAAHMLSGEAGAEPFLKHAGIAYALTGLLRAIPVHAAQQKIYLPLDILAQEGVSVESVFSGSTSISLNRVVRRLAGRAREHLELARKNGAGASLIAALPGALVPLYAKRMTRKAVDPLHDASDVPLFRRQLSLLRAATVGRL
jgi:phytoene synthase